MTFRSNLSSRRAQGGVVLFVALIMLVAMSIAGIALVQSVGSSIMLAGNLSAKAVTTRASDFVTETAGAFILASVAPNDAILGAASALYVNGYSPVMNGPAGFIPNSQLQFDPVRQTSAWWTANSMQLDADDMPDAFNDGFTAQYVIHRMCQNPGPQDDNCVTVNGPPQPCNVHTIPGCVTGTQYVLYRVTMRVLGPKNTESYVQVVMY